MKSNIPEHVSEKILKKVEAELKPKLSLLLTKAFIIHLMTAALTLSICSQLGVKLFKFDLNLMHSFMFLGMPVCNFLCGLFFTATSVIVASFVLTRDEIRALVYHKVALLAVLLLGSIGFFEIMNPNLFLEFSFLWLFGAVLGILGTLEISKRLVLTQN